MKNSKCKIELFLTALLLFACAVCAAEPEFVDVFKPGKDADGYPAIRIPSVIVAKIGTVLAFAEGRQTLRDQSVNKIVLKRSSDGGRTWGAIETIAADGENSLNNPCAVVEQSTGRVILMYQFYPAGLSEKNAKLVPGVDGAAVLRNFVMHSDDNGATWSKPLDITKSAKRPERVTTLASGPGIGIQLLRGAHAGRLLIPFNEGPYYHWNVYAVFSDDKGETWRMGEVAPGAHVANPKGGAAGAEISLVNEVQFVELSDGSVMLNSRRWAGKPVRKTAVSANGGETWSAIVDAPELIDPGCMGSILRYRFAEKDKPGVLLYSGPDSTKRANGTVYASFDDGKSWPVKRVLAPGAFAYSVLTVLSDGTIGCLYEADDYKRIVFARFSLEWVTEKK